MLKQTLIATGGWFLINRLYNKIFKNKTKKKYILSLTNASLMLGFSGYQILCTDLKEEMTYTQKLFLSIIKGYFLYDSVNVIIKQNYLYMAHHGLSLLIMDFFERYNYGRIFVQSLFIGELTNPLLNMWGLSKSLNYKRTFRVINHIFTPMFVLVRGIYMPIYFYGTLTEIYNDNRVTELDFGLICAISGVFNLGNYIWMNSLVKGYLKWTKS